MFEKKLAETFQKIFMPKKVDYDMPAPDAKEQEGLFIIVEKSYNTFKDGRAIARVEGRANMVAQHEKLPFGYFSKCISRANKELTKDLFFLDLEGNSQVYRNLVLRGFSFVYLFDSQFDPAIGSIETVSINITETP